MSETWTVDPADEGWHEPGTEHWWNESWYADVVAPDGSFGAYLRLGVTPVQDRAWLLVAVAGPGRPTVLVDLKDAPVPAGLPVVATADGFELQIEVVEPLRTWRVTGSGRARAYDDPAAILRGEPGADAEVAFDLTWSTDGSPYRYPVTTRYEIPCLVEGTVTVDGETTTLAAAVGQRDHSWGVRDWESAAWCWSACRLDDGTRLHLTQVEVPGLTIDLGYLQRDGSLVEVASATAEHRRGGGGLPQGTRLVLRPAEGPETAVDVEVVAHGPTTVPVTDGTQPFPRAMARCTTDDGRSGLGWLEWHGLDVVLGG